MRVDVEHLGDADVVTRWLVIEKHWPLPFQRPVAWWKLLSNACFSADGEAEEPELVHGPVPTGIESPYDPLVVLRQELLKSIGQ